MGESREPEGPIATEFLLRLLCDREEPQGIRRLSEYLRDYPGHEEEIAREYLQVSERTEEREDRPQEDDSQQIGPYRLLRELGRGGQAIVHLARDQRLDRFVALKVLNQRAAAADDLLLRFRREARVASRLAHPGICTVFEAGLDGQIAYIAMQYVEGESLQARVERSQESSSRAQLEEDLLLVEKACRALQVAHDAGVIHRDLKPGNIMVGRDGQPVLVDFGLARDQRGDTPTLTGKGEIFGTPVFMSPEQICGAEVDAQSDVYAMGVILYVVLCGQLPVNAPTFEAQIERLQSTGLPSPGQINSGLPKDLITVFRTATHAERSRRYSSAAALADELQRVRKKEPIQARRPSLALRSKRWIARNPYVATLILLLTLSVVGATFFGLRSSDRLQEILRLSDLRKVRAQLLVAREQLFPVGPALVAPCREWLAQSAELESRRGLHRRFLLSVRSRGHRVGAGWVFDDPADAWLNEVMTELDRGLRELELESSLVEERLARSATLERRTLTAPQVAKAWREAIEAIATSPRYDELDIDPQLGLIPLGTDPGSGLWEFWHVESGSRPRRGSDGIWRLEEGSGLVLGLLPGGEFEMGDDRSRAPFLIRGSEEPPHSVRLSPFFLSKYEMTQAQWMRAHRGVNPAYFQPGSDHGWTDAPEEMAVMTLLHPVESVTWAECRCTARALGLRLPTEAQWEYACRAGTPTDNYWSTGRDVSSLEGYANLLGRGNDSRLFEGRPPPDHEDRHRFHAPVGEYRANPFGLFDMHGNVAEWCQDERVRHYLAVDPRFGDGLRVPKIRTQSRIFRGGSMRTEPSLARSAYRSWTDVPKSYQDLGLRPARALSDRY